MLIGSRLGGVAKCEDVEYERGDAAAFTAHTVLLLAGVELAVYSSKKLSEVYRCLAVVAALRPN